MSRKDIKTKFFIPLMVAIMVGCFSLVTVLIGGTIIYILMDFEVIEGTIQELLLVAFIISYVVALFMTFLLSKIPLRPIRLLIEKMDRLTSGDYNVRIKLTKSLERHNGVKELSESFNMLAEELGNTEMLRGDFINNFSHEFKTPIVSIAGFTKLLKKGNLTEEQKAEYLDIIEEESLRLSAMATNVLNLTKVENQTILTDVSAFNLSEQLRKCVLLSEGKWSKKNISFDLQFEEYMITAGEELLKQVWINLIDNAIKFSPEGATIAIDVSESDGELLISVCNEGEEITEEQKKRIFNKFYQADESHSSEGNGIGLALVKKVVELHKGTVSVESKSGKTIFEVNLPKN